MVAREEILKLFPRDLRMVLSRAEIDFDQVEEIRLRAEKPLFLLAKGKEYVLAQDGSLAEAGGLSEDRNYQAHPGTAQRVPGIYMQLFCLCSRGGASPGLFNGGGRSQGGRGWKGGGQWRGAPVY